MHLQQLTLRQKLHLTVFPLALMGIVISLITWRSLRDNATPLIQAQQLRGLSLSSLSLLLTQDDATKTMMLDPDNPTTNIRKIKAYDENQKILEQITKLSPSADIRQTVQQMADLDAKVLRDIDTSVLEAVGDGKVDKARQLYFGSYEPQRAKYEGYVRKVVQLAEQQSRTAEKQLQQSNASSLRKILSALIVGVSVVGLCLAGLAQSVTKRMNRVVSRLTHDYDAAHSSTELISEASSSLSEGVSQSASAIERIDTSVTEFASKLRVTDDHAKFAQECSAKAVASADHASEALKSLLTTAKENQKSSERIMSVIKVIDDISFKTNILALNAAVEAARAGDAGLGFSVVAQEVRNLAQSSADAAKETAALIETSVKKSKEGFEMSEQAARALAEIVSESHRIHNLIGDIAANTRSQNENVHQITESLSRIGSIGQHNAEQASNTQQVAETLRHRSSSMQEVIGELAAVVGSSAE